MPAVSGTTKNSAGVLAQKLVRVYRRDLGALVGSVLSDATTGAWSVTTADTTEHFALAHDAIGDPMYDKVVLSMPFTSALTDAKGNSFTTVGGAALTGTNPKFASTQCLACDGSGDYLSCATPNFSFGSGDFSIEAWARHATGGDGTIVGKQNSYDSGVNFSIKINSSGAGAVLQFMSDFGGTGTGNLNLSTGGSSGIVITDWHHYCVERNGSAVKIYIDGVLKATSGAISGAMFSNAEPLFIGSAKYAGSANYFLNGALADLRITTGVARHGGAFTPGSTPNLQGPTGGAENAIIYDRLIPV